ncbi:AT-hook motif nuclear-localized protein 17-like [Phalaenopsis equestris]|uniref:AT-hook motif nuclear-localized protein 17-like n=1 Tax=Phalaenopsis equestris TaxID=78828 RepID=UPI0009E41578|nr:AT-hook motif nuclear-localized protein 17-like [Phalaenopsis equestris]
MILNSLDIMKPEPFSDEVDSLQGIAKRRKDGERKERKPPQQPLPPPPPPQLSDGASIEIVKRPRGRPPGSKNRPKPPVVITKESEPSAAMRPYVLEIPSGHDIIDSLTRFSRHRKLGICVLAATGAAVNVTIQQAGAEAAIVFHGRFEILSISATFMPPEMAALSPAAAVSAVMTLSLAGPHGQVIGGTVAGPLLASGVVMVVAAAFANTTFHRLPLEEEASVSVSGEDATGEVAAQRQYHDEEQQNFFHHFHLQQSLPRRRRNLRQSRAEWRRCMARTLLRRLYGHLEADRRISHTDMKLLDRFRWFIFFSGTVFHLSGS